MWQRDEQRAAHALDRYLQGVRVSAIAAELAISPSTVRRWITLLLTTIADEERAARVARLQAAIESQRAILREAWVAYHREQALEDHRLNGAPDHRRRPTHCGAPKEAYAPPTRANHAVRFLRLALTAQREIARLQGLYTYQQPPNDHITFTVTQRPNGPENQPPAGYLLDAPLDAPSHQILPGGGRLPHEPLSPSPFPCEGKVADRPDGVRAPLAATSDAQTTRLVQTAQLSTPGALASSLIPSRDSPLASEARSAKRPLSCEGGPHWGLRGLGVRSGWGPASVNQRLTHRQRKRLRELQALQQQPAHQLRSLAYSGP